jgi:hypothetical protein
MGTGGSKSNEGNDQLALIDNSHIAAGGADNTNTNNNYGSTNTATNSIVMNYTSANLNEYIVKPSNGCWFGCFATKQNVFMETNWNGLKPNVTELSYHNPSCGLWFGTFCRKMIPKQQNNAGNKKKNNNRKNNSRRSTMVCDGGGWCHSDEQRTVFKMVLQDEVTKGGSKKKGRRR